MSLRAKRRAKQEAARSPVQPYAEFVNFRIKIKNQNKSYIKLWLLRSIKLRQKHFIVLLCLLIIFYLIPKTTKSAQGPPLLFSAKKVFSESENSEGGASPVIST
jgi:hypothetical protein